MFRAGQRVICIDDDFRVSEQPAATLKRHNVTDAPRKGRIYVVYSEYLDALILQEFSLTVGWCASHFRPVVSRKTDISIFEEMLKPSKVTADLLKIADFCRDCIE